MAELPENLNHHRMVALGLGVGGVAVFAAGGILAARHHLGRPKDLNHEKAVTFKKGAVIMTASALALQRGLALTFTELRDMTDLSRHNASWGVNFLLQRGMAGRQSVGPNHEIDYLWAAEPLMAAAIDPKTFPLLATHMKLLRAQQYEPPDAGLPGPRV